MNKTSTEGTKYMLDLVTKFREAREQDLARLVVATSVFVTVVVGREKVERFKSIPVTEVFEVKATDTYTRYDDEVVVGGREIKAEYGPKVLDFAKEKAAQVEALEKQIKNALEHAAFLEKKIADWKPHVEV